MKHLSIALAVAFCASAVSSAALANPNDKATPQAAEQTEAVLDEVATGSHASDKRRCLQSTGTRIRSAAERCDQLGRVYTRDDLERSHGGDLGEALRRLDPAIVGGRIW